MEKKESKSPHIIQMEAKKLSTSPEESIFAPVDFTAEVLGAATATATLLLPDPDGGGGGLGLLLFLTGCCVDVYIPISFLKFKLRGFTCK